MSVPTVYDVAAQAGVSIATVSRVYRNPDTVRAATRERVLAAGRELGYLPSGSARGLASRATGVLGLFFPDFQDALAENAPTVDETELTLYADQVIRGMERAARRQDHALLIAAAHTDRVGERLARVAGQVDGLALLVPAGISDEDLRVVARRIPVVVLAGDRHMDLDHIEVANFDGELELTRHLIDDHGVRRLAFVGGPVDSPDGEARFRGFQAALREAGLPVPERPDARGDLTYDAGRSAVESLFDRPGPRPRGLVLANDQMAVGALHALASRGVRVPDDMVVAGFDGIPLGRAVRPALTTVRQPMARLGQEAVELLVARMADRERPPVARVLPVTVLRRTSCGCDDR